MEGIPYVALRDHVATISVDLSSVSLSQAEDLDVLNTESSEKRILRQRTLDEDDQEIIIKFGDDERRTEDDQSIQKGEKEHHKYGKVAIFRQIMLLARPELWMILTATVVLMMASGLNLMLPIFVGAIIDILGGKQSTVTNILQRLFGINGSNPIDVLTATVIALLTSAFLAAILSMEMEFFERTRTAELISRLGSDTTTLQDAVSGNISMGMRSAAAVLIGIVYLFALSWKLTLVMLAVVPPISIGARIFGRRIRALSKRVQTALARATEVSEESISQIRTVRAFHQEPRQIVLYGRAINRTFLLARRSAIFSALFIGLTSFAATASMIAVLYYGAILVMHGELSTGMLTSFSLYTLNVGLSFATLSGLFGSTMQAIGASEKVLSLLHREPTIPITGGTKLENFRGEIEFRNVRFAYPSRPNVTVLNNVSFKLLPGQLYAVVGSSGAGKSTIMNLIERFYDVNSGQVLLDGHDVRNLDGGSMHRQIALISQEPALFATSIRENLLFSAPPNTTEEELRAACEQANALEFIERFPKGLSTIVGERGQQLSAGQRQRIAVARAILMKSSVVLADEASSALDAESERLVQEALDKLITSGIYKATVLVIAHRLSTVRNADCILVLDAGQIVESGTHDELLAKGGVYAQLVRRQIFQTNHTDDGKLHSEMFSKA